MPCSNTSESESELFTGDTPKDLWFGELVPSPHKRSKLSN